MEYASKVIGKKYTSVETGNFTIIKYNNASDVDIQFDDGTIVKRRRMSTIRTGNVRNPNFKNVYGIAYFGEGIYNSKNHRHIYLVWHGMLTRCYNDVNIITRPNYLGCTVDERWHNFQVFAEWYQNNYNDGWALDKDILIKNNKIYGPDTCCFVPQEINNIFTKSNNKRGKYPIGVTLNKQSNKYAATITKYNIQYGLGNFKTIEEAFNQYKIEKEKYIKEVADTWKFIINIKVYQAMYNYIVEITD